MAGLREKVAASVKAARLQVWNVPALDSPLYGAQGTHTVSRLGQAAGYRGVKQPERFVTGRGK
jgi:hypothetical protein